MPYIVVDLPRDPVALFHGSKLYLVILIFAELLVFLLEQQVHFLRIISCQN